MGGAFVLRESRAASNAIWSRSATRKIKPSRVLFFARSCASSTGTPAVLRRPSKSQYARIPVGPLKYATRPSNQFAPRTSLFLVGGFFRQQFVAHEGQLRAVR